MLEGRQWTRAIGSQGRVRAGTEVTQARHSRCTRKLGDRGNWSVNVIFLKIKNVKILNKERFSVNDSSSLLPQAPVWLGKALVFHLLCPPSPAALQMACRSALSCSQSCGSAPQWPGQLQERAASAVALASYPILAKQASPSCRTAEETLPLQSRVQDKCNSSF